MTVDLQFAPVFPRHAIERCAATVGFVPALPDKAFDRLIAAVTPILQNAGLIPQATVSIGFMVGPDGKMVPMDGGAPGGGPRVFSLPDQTSALTITPDGLVWAISTYVRWQPFVGGVEKNVLPVLKEFLSDVSIAAVKLEYWDRFLWSGTWENFDVGKLLKKGSGFIAQEAATRPKQWHSHSGWFDNEAGLRRLTNVNVDLAEVAVDPSLPPRPSVGIYSSLTDQTNVPEYGMIDISALGESFVVERLEHQHLALKDILGHIITDEMATRIGLNPRKPQNAGA
ncbi:hypothetical protein [Tardiphaga robiniae]|uniref:hypothetical protein n=1 Tax=Tardiphaga robiniae TaxID=943830 RepID=UPI0015860A93|nr:hypothetical protein [Tardiphaga robiniae]NUU44539.1 hypothetical protein [Tardiphaga robiniae]